MSLQDFSRYVQNAQFTFELGFRHAIASPNCGFHSHDFFELVYHLKGSGTFTIEGGKRIPFAEKSIVIHPPRLMHNQTTQVPAEDICIQFSGPKSLWKDLGSCFYLDSIEGLPLSGDILTLADTRAPISSLEHAACNHFLSAIIARILAIKEQHVNNERLPHTDYASSALSYLRDNMNTISNLEHVAKALGISYDHLRHLYAKKYGKCMKEELISIRLNKAKRLLAQTPLPLKAIAAQCGFSSDRYFCMAFKVQEGKTPGAFRRLKPMA